MQYSENEMATKTYNLTNGKPILEIKLAFADGERSIKALIDTGASHTMISPEIVKKLGLNKRGQTGMNTPNGRSTTNEFKIHINSLDLNLNDEVTVYSKDNYNMTEAILIGRDILSKGIFVYNGKIKCFTLEKY